MEKQLLPDETSKGEGNRARILLDSTAGSEGVRRHRSRSASDQALRSDVCVTLARAASIFCSCKRAQNLTEYCDTAPLIL